VQKINIYQKNLPLRHIDTMNIEYKPYRVSRFMLFFGLTPPRQLWSDPTEATIQHLCECSDPTEAISQHLCESKNKINPTEAISLNNLHRPHRGNHSTER
jgi:hypothetical protein